jgi:predicted ester cyclase
MVSPEKTNAYFFIGKVRIINRVVLVWQFIDSLSSKMKAMKNLPPTILITFCLLLTSCAATKNLKKAEANKETIRVWFEEGWNKGQNEKLIPRVFHPEWSDGNPIRPESEGLEGMYELVKFYKEAFPDAKFRITHLFADTDYAAVRYEVEATHAGEAFGLKPTGRKFTSTGIVMYDMKEGKIYRSWQELDLMGIINQLKD